MPWEFREDAPIYTQLIAQIQQRIVGGLLGPGARLPSVRDLAAEAGVNPNTMQRALTELEREGIVHSQRTAGRFVTEDAERLRQLREELARQQVKDFFTPAPCTHMANHLFTFSIADRKTMQHQASQTQFQQSIKK